MTAPGRRARLCLLAAVALAGAAAPPALAADPDAAALARIASPPLGLPAVPTPPENPPTAAKLRLGRKLFFDRRLSYAGTMSCGMCHVPEQGFTSNELGRAVGTGGHSLRRNAPSLYNVAYVGALFLDGRETALETQVISPLLDRREMAAPSMGWVIERLRRLPDYGGLFEAAFGAGPSVDRLGAAIASWERSLLSAGSPFDRWRYAGQADAMSAEAKAGFRLFTGGAGCSACHTVADDHALFTDGDFHDTGIGYRNASARRSGSVPVQIAPGVTVEMSRQTVAAVGEPPAPDRGRYEVTLDPADLWRLRTPGLRNVALTAPYMHDGSIQTLEAVVRFYAAGGEPHDGLDPLIRPLELGEGEIAALVAFLERLTGDNVAELQADARSAPVGNPGLWPVDRIGPRRSP